jgi:hypothetical protein
MDPDMAAAGRALAAGNPLAALKLVALREDAGGLALRGIAMAQLGEFKTAQRLLEQAVRAFGARKSLPRARCVLAQAEVALATRELDSPGPMLDQAIRIFASKGETRNLLHAQLLMAQRLVLLGHVHEAEKRLASIELKGAPPMLCARAELLAYEIALRRCQASMALKALRRAWAFAQRARIPALLAELEQQARALEQPVARAIEQTVERPLSLAEVEALFSSPCVVVDALRRAVRCAEERIDLTRRPVLFSLVRALAEAWPHDVTRDTLVQKAFGARRADASHRARLRVEMGRLRKALSPLGDVHATKAGFVLAPRSAQRVSLLAPPIEGEGASVLALLSDGEGWSTSALALALGKSQRVVQRTLAQLAAEGRVRSSARGRSQRWLVASAGTFATTLLLPVLPPTS